MSNLSTNNLATAAQRHRTKLNLARLPRTAILAATQNERFSGLGRRYGMRLGASRFVAGETLDDCVTVLRSLSGEGFRVYAVMLGESVRDPEAVANTVSTYQAVVNRLANEQLPVTLSMKLTHIGLEIDPELAFQSAHMILSTAARRGVFARIDMEGSAWTEATLAVYRELCDSGITNTGVVLQAYLYRAIGDLESLREAGANIRLVKGAYLEPSTVAFSKKADVDSNYLKMIDIALQGPGYTAIATHDERAIAHATARIATNPAAYADRYEFQMLYGVRPHLQRRLVREGHPVRVCVPYGDDWYVYFGRRLAERPANVLFVLRNLIAR